MRFKEAREIMEKKVKKGFRVSFERVEGIALVSDHFPERDEDPIKTEEEAWRLEDLFAKKTAGGCVNIYVVDEAWKPVPNYKRRMIFNR